MAFSGRGRGKSGKLKSMIKGDAIHVEHESFFFTAVHGCYRRGNLSFLGLLDSLLLAGFMMKALFHL